MEGISGEPAMQPKLEPSWLKVLQAEFRQPYMYALRDFLRAEKRQYTVYPPGPRIFHAFEATPFEAVKVVILGQDPYHGPGQAEGLCFSVPETQPLPPSLQNIYKEIQDDLGCRPLPNGHLESWARQGVFLLNTTLTVREHQPLSHKDHGWETFTDAVIKALSAYRDGLVFLLWGSPAQRKRPLIDETRHTVLTAPHPSPLSAYRGFFGCKHFSQTNRILEQRGLTPIEWGMPKAD